MKLHCPKEIRIRRRTEGVGASTFPPFAARVYRPLRQKWISSSSADQKINFLMFGVELKVVCAVFLPKPSLGSPRLRLGPNVPYLYSFVARSGLKLGSLDPFLERKPRKLLWTSMLCVVSYYTPFILPSHYSVLLLM